MRDNLQIAATPTTNHKRQTTNLLGPRQTPTPRHMLLHITRRTPVRYIATPADIGIHGPVCIEFNINCSKHVR